MKPIRIGAGAGYSGDRIEPAVELAEKGDLDYLVFECLAERTVALAQQAKRRDPNAGYDPLLEARMRATLPACRRNNVRIVTNMGAANPGMAAASTARIASDLGLSGIKIAIVEGDDVQEWIETLSWPEQENERRIEAIKHSAISANAYLGAESLVQALAQGADIVMCGRIADPCLFLAPMIHEFGWSFDDWDRLGQGIAIGHLLECAGQVSGGYFADPGLKDVAGLARLGFPLAEIEESGAATVTKVAGSGGLVSLATCSEQLLYEIHDPSHYITPDAIADFTQICLQQTGIDRVRVTGGRGKARPENLKVSVGYLDGYHGEGQISYGGPGAVARGRLALAIVEERLKLIGARYEEARYDLIGMTSLYGDILPQTEPAEVRIRVAARTQTRQEAEKIANEVETLYTNGPSGGGGASKAVREIVAVESSLLPRLHVTPSVRFLEV